MENHDSRSIYESATPLVTDLLPWEPSQPIQTPQYRLSSRLIAMIQNLSFSGKEDENPYLHIRDFEQTCDCLRIEGISDKTLRWKLFPFSLRGEARRWYSQKVGQQQGEWGVLRANFCLDFYSLDRIADLRLEVLSFKQKDNETLGKSWKRFSDLLESGPNLSLEDPILLFHFLRGLQYNHKQMLHTMSRGSFFYIPANEAKGILNRILEAEMDNTLHEKTHEAEVDTLPNSSSTLAIPGSEPQTEEIPLPDFMLDIESDLFADFGNISNYYSIDKPQNGQLSICLPSEILITQIGDKDDINEHGSYTIIIYLEPCSYETSLGLSILYTFEISNPLTLPISRNFKRVVVDAYVYHKYCRSRILR